MSKLSRFVYNNGHQKSREITREIWRSERELYHCQNYWNFEPECEYSKHKAFRVRKATGTFKKPAPVSCFKVARVVGEYLLTKFSTTVDIKWLINILKFW